MSRTWKLPFSLWPTTVDPYTAAAPTETLATSFNGESVSAASSDTHNSRGPRDAALNEIVTSLIATCGCTREGIVLVGDSPYDVATGERGGIDVIALRCGGWTDATLQGAVAIRDKVVAAYLEISRMQI